MKIVNLLLLIMVLCGCSFNNHTSTLPFKDIIHVKKPAYPNQAFKEKIQGYVLVEFNVNENGETFNIRLHSTPDKIFEGAARQAVSEWRYKKGSPRKDIQLKLIFLINDPGLSKIMPTPHAPV